MLNEGAFEDNAKPSIFGAFINYLDVIESDYLRSLVLLLGEQIGQQVLCTCLLLSRGLLILYVGSIAVILFGTYTSCRFLLMFPYFCFEAEKSGRVQGGYQNLVQFLIFR